MSDYVLANTLKLPGAWWKMEMANDMLALRTVRINNHWSDYWDGYGSRVAV